VLDQKSADALELGCGMLVRLTMALKHEVEFSYLL
jgi:hypothetical protein